MEKIKQLIHNLQELVDKHVPINGGIIFTQENWKALKEVLNTFDNEIREEEKRHNLNALSPQGEQVNHPKHYQGSKYECIDVMADVFGKEKTAVFCELNAFKYQWRADKKGASLQDKKKAIWYLNKYIELNKN